MMLIQMYCKHMVWWIYSKDAFLNSSSLEIWNYFSLRQSGNHSHNSSILHILWGIFASLVGLHEKWWKCSFNNAHYEIFQCQQWRRFCKNAWERQLHFYAILSHICCAAPHYYWQPIKVLVWKYHQSTKFQT